MSAHPQPQTGWLSLNQAAALLGLSSRTLRRELARGHLAAWRTPGGHARLAYADIERYAREMSIPLDPPATAPRP